MITSASSSWSTRHNESITLGKNGPMAPPRSPPSSFSSPSTSIFEPPAIATAASHTPPSQILITAASVSRALHRSLTVQWLVVESAVGSSAAPWTQRIV